MTLSIRLLSQEDVSYLRTWSQQGVTNGWSDTQIEASFNHERNHCFALVEGEKLVGFAIYEQLLGEATLENIVIAPESRNRGYGKRLLQESMAIQQTQSIRRFLLEVRASNKTAISLYKKLGFIEDGRRKHYYPAPVQSTTQVREDALLLSLAVDELVVDESGLDKPIGNTL